jgi:hypothetical protein
MGVSTSLNLWLAQHVPHTFDARLWHWNEAMHLDPLAMIYFMEAHEDLGIFMQVVYYALPIVMVVAWIKEQNPTLRRAVAIAGVGGWIFSAIFPALGPHWYLDGYTMAMRHCVPAVDLTWALLLALNARSRLCIPLWTYTGLLAIASILLGEHYLIDLIVAVPYTLAVQWLASRRPGLVAKLRPTAAGISSGQA